MQPAVSGVDMDVPLRMAYDPSGTGNVLSCDHHSIGSWPLLCRLLQNVPNVTTGSPLTITAQHLDALS